MDEVRLTPEDAGEVLTLQRAAYVSEAQLYGDLFLPALVQSLAELRQELERPALGLRIGPRLVGAVRWRVDGDTAHIGRLAVAPDQQGRGLGTRLLRAAQERSGVSRFELFTGHLSEANIRLYQREGFVIDRREPLRPGTDLIFLVKDAGASHGGD